MYGSSQVDFWIQCVVLFFSYHYSVVLILFADKTFFPHWIILTCLSKNNWLYNVMVVSLKKKKTLYSLFPCWIISIDLPSGFLILYSVVSNLFLTPFNEFFITNIGIFSFILSIWFFFIVPISLLEVSFSCLIIAIC